MADCYGSKLFTTNPRCKIEGVEHIEFHEHEPRKCTDAIVENAIIRFKNRKLPVEIPQIRNMGIHGFSHEYINYMLGGSYRSSLRPLNDAIMSGRIRGVVANVGCNNPRVQQDSFHNKVVADLLKNDVLVVETGCGALASAKCGYLLAEAAMEYAGPGLREVCEAVGIPPVLHMGSCVDNTRILTVLAQMATEGGLGDDISDIPAVGLAPEWMSEKAMAIASYVARDAIAAREIIRRDDEVDALYLQIFRELLTYILEDRSTISQAIDLILVARFIERIADQATNIAEEVVYLVEAEPIRHQHLDHEA